MNYIKLLFDLCALRRSARMNTAQMRGLQEKKLRELLHYAYDHSPYYREAFQASGIQKEEIDLHPLRDFPTLDKAALLGNFDKLITIPGLTQEEMRRFDKETEASRDAYQGKYHVVHSSGSTGKPGYFLYDDSAWNTMLSGILRGALWGMTNGEIGKLLLRGPRIVYLAATGGRYGGAMAVGDGVDGLHAKQLHLDINTPLAQWKASLREFEPNIIIGYPSAIKILADMVERGEIELDILRVISCGEPLSVPMRRHLEGVFSAVVVNFYGASESLALGVEVDPREGMLLFDDLNIVESIGGSLYVTCLYNFAQPLIRYRITDRLTLEAPEQGSPFTRAVGLVGRNEDILWFTDGYGHREFLHPLSVEGFCVEGLRDYQFRQTGSASFQMLAETAPDGNRPFIRAEMLRQMRAILMDKGLGYVAFTVAFVDCIRPDPNTGKKKLIVSAMEPGRRVG